MAHHRGAVKAYGANGLNSLIWQSLVRIFITQEVVMHPRDIRVENPREALIVEQALAMYRELKRTADAAPDGQVLAQAELLAVAQGRELTRQSLEAVLGEQAEEVEKKGRAADPVRAAALDTTAARDRGKSSRRQAR
jgi:hypothetical protein